MKAVLTVFVLIILYIAIELGVFWFRVKHLPVLARPDQSEKTLGTGPSLRYIAAGDSTAVGIGASSLEKTYPYAVLNELAKTHTVVYKNIGVVGAKTGDVLKKQIDAIVAYKPDIVTISIGGNDAAHMVGTKTILQNYKNIISELTQKTGAEVYITDIPNFNGATLLPWFYIKMIEYRSARLNPELLKLEAGRIKFVDIHNFGEYLFPHPERTYAADHFHPNDLGYGNWSNAFLDKIK